METCKKWFTFYKFTIQVIKEKLMKFTIIIPSQNRPELLALAVKYAVNQHYKNVEIIVSDNSTDDHYREANYQCLFNYLSQKLVTLIRPSRILSAPEHFEFALGFATGDYVLFLTDKMFLLPDTLDVASSAIGDSGAEIVNWIDCAYIPNDWRSPDGAGLLRYSAGKGERTYRCFDPLLELKSKASGKISRQKQSKASYVTGKICFGCFSKDLISRIKVHSGELFGGATHDYSAMVQGLLNSRKCIMLKQPGVLHFNLPRNRSLGNMTHYDSKAAYDYFQSFRNPSEILEKTLVPELYSSQHNMVAHDYIKYLGLYGKSALFDERLWLLSIGHDLYLPEKTWTGNDERDAQLNLFYSHLKNRPRASLSWWISFLVALPIRNCLRLALKPIRAARGQLKLNFPVNWRGVSHQNDVAKHCPDLSFAIKSLGNQKAQ